MKMIVKFLQKKYFLLFFVLLPSFFSPFKIFGLDFQYNPHLLTENVYRIINTAHSFDLPGNIKELTDKSRYEKESIGMGYNKFEHAFSFIKKENGYLIKSLLDDNYLCVENDKLGYQKFFSGDPSIGFLWDIKFVNNSICKICSIAKKSFLIIQKIQDRGNSGQRSIFYRLDIGDERIERNILGFDSNNSEWRLNPFYPSSGYSDFFKIIKDCGELIALKYNAELKLVKTAPTSSHDFECLSVRCLDKTNICLRTHYKPTMREVFTIQDVFKSNLPNEVPSSVINVTHEIETEEVFQTTIENCLTTLQRKTGIMSEKSIRKKTHEEAEDWEKMDQIGFSQSLNTLLSIAVARETEIGNTTGSRESRTLGESFRQETYEDIGNSTSTGSLSDIGNSTSKGTLRSQNSGHNVSVEAGVKAGPVSAGGSYGYHTGQSDQSSHDATHSENTQKSSNVTSTKSSGISQSMEKRKEETEERYGEQTNRVSDSREIQNQIGSLREDRKDQVDTKTKRMTNIKEDASEQENLRELGVEQSLDLTEVKSITHKKNKKWFIEREFTHIPNTMLQVKFFEEAIEATDHPFEVCLHISGHVGFTFNKNILVATHPRRDYLTGNTWFLSPATILNYLKAPGYKINEDGSINYIVNGKINLKHPLNILTYVNQDNLPVYDNS